MKIKILGGLLVAALAVTSVAQAQTLHMTDIAPTVSALLHIQMPSGSIGNVIEDLFK